MIFRFTEKKKKCFTARNLIKNNGKVHLHRKFTFFEKFVVVLIYTASILKEKKRKKCLITSIYLLARVVKTNKYF